MKTETFLPLNGPSFGPFFKSTLGEFYITIYNRPFKTYEIMPTVAEKDIYKCNYTDTADTGSDFLCSICYNELPFGLYVTDILYTKKSMEYTEQATAEMLVKNKTRYCDIESNNGGRGFMRNVEKIVRTLGDLSMTFNGFAQTLNKNVRIFSHSNEVNNMVCFPYDWERLWPDFARAVKGYRKEGGNLNDDAPDVLTGMVENIGQHTVQMTDEEILQDFL